MKIIKFRALCLVATTTVVLTKTALADDNPFDRGRASSHAPIGVMGDHLHKKGEFMFSYRFMKMDMEGSRVGTNRVSDRSVVGTAAAPGQFLVVPTRMPMEMHMLGGMYGLNDNVTLMGMVSYVDNYMDHLIRNGRRFTTASSGIGDTKVSALVRVSENAHHNWHIGFGLSLPTGSTTERDDTPAMANAVLPYPMQLGSGTYDILPSLTYSGGQNSYTWGAQVSAVIRTGENDEGYTLGNRFGITSWVASSISDSLSVSLRINYQDTGGTDGRNPLLNPAMVQTANTRLHAGERIDASIGANYLFKNGHRLAVEYSAPLHQDLAGPQLEIDSVLTVGWQKAY